MWAASHNWWHDVCTWREQRLHFAGIIELFTPNGPRLLHRLKLYSYWNSMSTEPLRDCDSRNEVEGSNKPQSVILMAVIQINATLAANVIKRNTILWEQRRFTEICECQSDPWLLNHVLVEVYRNPNPNIDNRRKSPTTCWSLPTSSLHVRVRLDCHRRVHEGDSKIHWLGKEHGGIFLKYLFTESFSWWRFFHSFFSRSPNGRKITWFGTPRFRPAIGRFRRTISTTASFQRTILRILGMILTSAI